MMSPIAAIASGIRPPAPRPWTARPAISIPIDIARPLMTDPVEKSVIAEQEERPPPVDVGELPVQRDGHCRAEHVGGEDPRVVLEAAEVAGDLRQGGGDDRLVERGEEHAEHEPEEDDQGPALAEGIDGAVIHFVT